MKRFDYAALQAICFEDYFYTDAINDWMDLRITDNNKYSDNLYYALQNQKKINRNKGGQLSECNSAWCHGKAGILLSRKCALLYADGNLKNKINRYYTNNIITRTDNETFCLCHGISGVSAINEIVNRINDISVEKILSIFCDDSYNFRDCLSLQERQNYGMMSGTAGIGYWLLADTSSMCTLLTGDINFLLKLTE